MMNKLNSLTSNYLFIHIVLILLIYLLTVVLDAARHMQVAFFIASVFIGLYFFVYIWSMTLVMKKKSVGLVVFTLFSKFFVLTGFVMYCVTIKSFNLLGLIIGLSTAIPSVVIWSLRNRKGIKIGTF